MVTNLLIIIHYLSLREEWDPGNSEVRDSPPQESDYNSLPTTPNWAPTGFYEEVCTTVIATA